MARLMRGETITAVAIVGGALGFLWMMVRDGETMTTTPKKINTSTVTLHEYITRMLPTARFIESEARIPASFSLAQSAIESRRGESYLSARYNNFFGIKAGTNWKGPVVNLNTREVINGEEKIVRAPFRSYATPEAGWLDWSEVVRRIAGGLESSDPYVWVDAVVKGGYATDPRYAEILKKGIARVERAIELSDQTVSGVDDLALVRRYLGE